MRILALALSLIPLPALAWEFRPDPVCTIFHDSGDMRVVVTWDPGAMPAYAISMTLAQGAWPSDPAFHIAFSGGRGLTIGTGRHELTDEGRRLTVRDRGFDNVLDGLEFNLRAAAWSGNRGELLDLSGAAPAVQAFRACAGGMGAMS
jgi:hypothetical protein